MLLPPHLHDRPRETSTSAHAFLRVSDWPLRVKLFAVNGSVLALVLLGLLSGFWLSTRIKDEAYALEREATEDVALIAELKKNLTKLIFQKNLVLQSEVSSATFHREFGNLIFEYQQFKQNWVRLLASEEFSEGESPGDDRPEVTKAEREAAAAIARDHRFPAEYYIRQFDELLLTEGAATKSRTELRAKLRVLESTSFVQQIDTFLDKVSALSRATDEEFAQARQLLQQASQRQMQIVALSLLLSGGTGLLLTMVLSELLTRPLSDITAVAEKSIRQENFTLQAPVQSGDEVGQLTRAFNSYMTFVRDLLHDRMLTNARLTATLNELKNTQTQIIQSEKMSSLGQMVAGVAHEINNPVTFIHSNIVHVQEYTEGLLELLELYAQVYPQPDPRITEKQDEIDMEFAVEDLPKTLVSMKVGSNRIREIVLSLRNFSRIDEAELKPVDIHEGIENTLLILNHRLKPQSKRAAIEIVREYGSIPAIECFAGLLNQAIMNVVSNAIDALEDEMRCGDSRDCNCKRDGARIAIRTSIVSDDRGDDWLQLSVSDNGPGIPAEIQARIFEPFFTTKAVGKGTGMGMSISYKIVTERHGGTLEYATSCEGGAEFVIRIPVVQSRSRATVAA